MPSIPQKVKACKKLLLPDNFEPVTTISHIIGIDLDEIISCLRPSQDENAMFICALYDRLTQPLRKAIDIDYLIAAAQCKDAHKIAGLISENYSRLKAIQTQMIAAKESPDIMRSSARFAKERKGFAHSRMILQSTGVAPVPKNQVTYNIGNKVDNSRNLNINVPKHEEIVGDVSRILASLPTNVSPDKDRAEDSGHRKGQGD